MKPIALLVFAAAFTGFSAHADNVIAEVKSVDRKIQSVQLTDTGTLKIVLQDGQTKQLHLSTTNAQSLQSTAKLLGQIETITTHQPAVCETILPDFAVQNLSVVEPANGKLKLTLSMRSCALPDYTFPKDENQLQDAEGLKTAMLVLAHQLAGN